MAVRSSLDGTLPSAKAVSAPISSVDNNKFRKITNAAHSSSTDTNKGKIQSEDENQISRLLLDEYFYYDAVLADASKNVDKASSRGMNAHSVQSDTINTEIMDTLDFVREINWVRDEAEMESVRLGHLEDLRLHVDNDNSNNNNDSSSREEGGTTSHTGREKAAMVTSTQTPAMTPATGVLSHGGNNSRHGGSSHGGNNSRHGDSSHGGSSSRHGGSSHGGGNSRHGGSSHGRQ